MIPCSKDGGNEQHTNWRSIPEWHTRTLIHGQIWILQLPHVRCSIIVWRGVSAFGPQALYPSYLLHGLTASYPQAILHYYWFSYGWKLDQLRIFSAQSVIFSFLFVNTKYPSYATFYWFLYGWKLDQLRFFSAQPVMFSVLDSLLGAK